MLDSVIKVIHTDSLGSARSRNKQLECLTRYTQFLKTEDREDVQQHLLDLWRYNKRTKEHEIWFKIANRYLAEVSSVDARQHGDKMSLSHFSSVIFLMKEVENNSRK